MLRHLKWWEIFLIGFLTGAMFFAGIRIASAGSTFQSLSEVTNIIKVNNDKEMTKILEQIREARILSAKGLSRDRIAQILAQAHDVIRNSKDQVDAGASVQCTSFVIE